MEDSPADPPGSKSKVETCGAGGTDKTGPGRCQQGKPAISEEEVAPGSARVTCAQLPPGHPCLEYLKGHGFEPGAVMDLEQVSGRPTLLQGRRWYVVASVSGRTVEFLVDTGASHSCISRRIHSLLPGEHDTFTTEGRACTADGSMMQTYGKTCMRFSLDGDKEFLLTPTIADVSDDGILGLDFAALYGAMLDAQSGVLSVKNPYHLEVQCVLRQVSSIASVAQTVKIPPGVTCDVLCRSHSRFSGKEGTVEPDMVMLSSIGLESADTLVGNAAWSVVPVSNRGNKVVYLEKGTTLGQTTLSECVSSAVLGLPDAAPDEALGPELENLLSGCVVGTDQERSSLRGLLSKHRAAFAAPGEKLGRTTKVLHTIDTGDAEPFKIPYRRLPLAKKRVAEDEIAKMLEQDVIVPSTSPWSSPVCMVTKKRWYYPFLY